MIIRIQFAPPLSVASGKRQAQSGERKPGAVCCQRVAAWVGRSVGGRFGDVLALGACHCLAHMFGRGCRVGICFLIVLPCARTRESSRKPQTLRQCIYYRKA